MHIKSHLLQLGLAASTFAQSTLISVTGSSVFSATSSIPVPSSTSLGGCAPIAELHQKTFEANTSATLRDVPLFSPSLALQCLTSVPIDKEAAVGLIKYFKPYLEFQSTLAWLKDPPKSYQQPAVDLMGGLENMTAQISAGSFTNQYDFELAIHTLLQGSHEGHLGLQTPLYSLFVFRSPFEFLSVSFDGVQLPQVFVHEDLALVAASTADLPWTISPVTLINDQKAEEFLRDYARKYAIGTIEPHADYNSVMYNAARHLGTGGVQSSPFGIGFNYLGSDTMNITFANGTEKSGNWQAAAQQNLTGIVTGEDLYEAIVAPQPITPSRPLGVSEVNQTLPALGAPYPSPIIVQEGLGFGGFISGYFLNETSLAVLSITSFLMPGELAESAQDTVQQFLREAKQAGMKKLVIDLQGNGGGTVLLGIDLFKQLFPTDEPYIGSRLRAHSSLDTIGRTIGSLVGAETLALGSPFYFGNSVDMDGQDFSDWADYYGPYQSHGDFYTATERYNLSDVANSEIQSGNGIVVSGYANETNIIPQYFAAEDILMLTDGYCASTCTVFAEQMKTHQGVKSVVVGGLPQIGPMQAVAGTRGALRYGADGIAITINATLLFNPSIDPSTLPSVEAPPINVPLSGININLRDQVREDAQDVPLQFIYEAADCRIFYTAEMLADYSVLWQRAADALWKNSSLCIEGSTNQNASGNETDSTGGPNPTDPTADDDSGASSLRSTILTVVAASLAVVALL
ncbi:hypothetical protein VTL71DRAFT_7577 [Oculimacula yallundae]|uniref:Tail specific protease domain-containing protein n=1 Tax=Oculimacula yallundae TaxID=86028 RepID=A0ABR4BUJ5_9HELO